ncbi:MAG: hypothetical protein ACK5Z5_02095 [Neisseriaceae bacterium]|jgi:16S rRNA A1518/A1519 N6-dimethyltransferase RsmA/KsgA/DIM1 with predicted DNA glycosylase/AP lyase activity
MSKKTLLIDKDLHSRMKEQLKQERTPLNLFTENAITYMLKLYKEGYRLIGGTLYQIATKEHVKTLSTEKHQEDKTMNENYNEIISSEVANIKTDDFMK